MYGKHSAQCLAGTVCSISCYWCYLGLTPRLPRSCLPRDLIHQVTVDNEEIHKTEFGSVRLASQIPAWQQMPFVSWANLHACLWLTLQAQPLIKSFHFKCREPTTFYVQHHVGRNSSTKGQVFNITRVHIRNRLSTVALIDRPSHMQWRKKPKLGWEEESKGQNLHSGNGASRDKSCKHLPLPCEHPKKSEANGERWYGFTSKMQDTQINLNFKINSAYSTAWNLLTLKIYCLSETHI